MAEARFKAGDIVILMHPWGVKTAGPYEVIRLLPTERADVTYKVRSVDETFDRVALEHELRSIEEPIAAPIERPPRNTRPSRR
ncbi:hypothetical protein GCM10007874_45550 [Labrys miyagiensis]|uniref:Uncharacterized protein n=1 Tax=Labrys miyagiensis TaxID=346912 RepID=A0ABQ6CMK2_9HYPH|nr:hypothetical protein GCM10007874_45550 [Labrys miyagiensis]